MDILNLSTHWPKIIVIILTAISIIFLGNFVQQQINNFANRNNNLNTSTLHLLAKLIKLCLWIIGLLVILSSLGIDISAIATTLGITGFAVGFAVKDTLSNVLSGILIMIYRPFNISDFIAIAGKEGKVTAIDLRYTTLEFQNKIILIPNSKIFSDPVTIEKND